MQFIQHQLRLNGLQERCRLWKSNTLRFESKNPQPQKASSFRILSLRPPSLFRNFEQLPKTHSRKTSTWDESLYGLDGLLIIPGHRCTRSELPRIFTVIVSMSYCHHTLNFPELRSKNYVTLYPTNNKLRYCLCVNVIQRSASVDAQRNCPKRKEKEK